LKKGPDPEETVPRNTPTADWAPRSRTFAWQGIPDMTFSYSYSIGYLSKSASLPHGRMMETACWMPLWNWLRMDGTPVGNPVGVPQAKSRNPLPLICLEKAFLIFWISFSGHRGHIPTCRSPDLSKCNTKPHYPKNSSDNQFSRRIIDFKTVP
jgi:hypothetical protein